MGMYTEIQGTIQFKTIDLANAFVCNWKAVSQLCEHVTPFVDFSRSGFIPNSGLGVKEVNGNIVKFHSELKNYDSTIQKFLDLLPLIADKWFLESRYEECSMWTLHCKGEESRYVNGDNYYEQEYSWPNKLEVTEYPVFDVFDEGNLL